MQSWEGRYLNLCLHRVMRCASCAVEEGPDTGLFLHWCVCDSVLLVLIFLESVEELWTVPAVGINHMSAGFSDKMLILYSAEHVQVFCFTFCVLG